MANTYIQIYVQFIFAVQGRQNLIAPSNREVLQRYISGIIKNSNQKLLAIYANPDHIHLLVGFNSLNLKISDFVRDIKANSSRFINEQNGCVENLIGRKVMLHFLILKARLIKLLIIF